MPVPGAIRTFLFSLAAEMSVVLSSSSMLEKDDGDLPRGLLM